MSTEVRSVSAVLQTSPTVLAKAGKPSIGSILNRFIAAPTVADTSVSRQTGLAGIWNNSNDPTSQASTLQPGVTNQMRTNTLVVRPDSLRIASKFPPASTRSLSLFLCSAKVSP